MSKAAEWQTPSPHRVRADLRSDTPMLLTRFGKSVNKALVCMCVSPAIKVRQCLESSAE